MIIEEMTRRLALPLTYLYKVAGTASYRYKAYPIPKKSGGTRTIHHPARELKLLQGWLQQNLLGKLPVHDAATAYRIGLNIRRNAETHVSNNYLLRVDFKDFFPSLRGRDVVTVLLANQNKFAEPVTELDISFIRQIVCRNDSLPIGAPTSPQLSNAIMFDFDSVWSRICRELEVTYTRYADDLYFSTNRPNVLRDVLQRLRTFLNQNRTPSLQINEQKTAFSSRKRRRLAAGLVLTSDRKVSIGRKKKRVLKSLVLKLKSGDLEAKDIASLRGWISYLHSVEPSFVAALQQKYSLNFGADVTWKTERKR